MAKKITKNEKLTKNLIISGAIMFCLSIILLFVTLLPVYNLAGECPTVDNCDNGRVNTKISTARFGANAMKITMSVSVILLVIGILKFVIESNSKNNQNQP